MKLKTKFIFMTTLGVTIAISNSIVSEWAGKKLEALSSEQNLSTEVLQRHMDADMKHDGIRGNVYSALFAAKTGNQELLKSSLQEVTDMGEEFAKDVNENAAVNTPDNIKAQFEKIKNSVAAYNDFSQKITAVAASDPERAIAMLPEFERVFGVLEEDQGAQSDMVLKWSDDLKKRVFEFNAFSSNIKLGLSLANIFTAISVLITAIRGIFRPMNKMIHAMTELSNGKNNTEIPYTDRKDEMGEMAHALQVFKDNALAMDKMREQQELQKRATEEQKKAAMRQLAEQFESTVKGVVDMVASAATEMDATSRSVSDVVDGNKEKLTSLTGQIAGTSENVQRVSSATNQLSSAINEISSQVSRAASITSSAVEEASKADSTTKGLVDASQKIGEVLEMINSIAAQINLLALNATIEAARAGEAGKGFAVVASEVKSLASQTTKATEQISSYINSIQGATTDTVGALGSISGKIRDINSIATTIAAAVEQQGVATKDIASNVQQAANSTEEVSRNANDVSASSEQTGNAAHEMTAATGELSRQAEILRSEVDKFLVGIRAA